MICNVKLLYLDWFTELDNKPWRWKGNYF